MLAMVTGGSREAMSSAGTTTVVSGMPSVAKSGSFCTPGCSGHSWPTRPRSGATGRVKASSPVTMKRASPTGCCHAVTTMRPVRAPGGTMTSMRFCVTAIGRATEATVLSSLTTVVVPALDIASREPPVTIASMAGPPLLENYALRFSGTLNVATAGRYTFALACDDGARVAIDGKWVVTNDGVHAVTTVQGEVDLAAGPHRVVVEYFQGARSPIALQLQWAPVGGALALVGPELFSRL